MDLLLKGVGIVLGFPGEFEQGEPEVGGSPEVESKPEVKTRHVCCKVKMNFNKEPQLQMGRMLPLVGQRP